MSMEACKRAFLKLIEIGINVICAALLFKYNCIPLKYVGVGVFSITAGDYTRTYIVVATIGAYLLISTLLLISYPLEGVNKAPRLETLMLIVGAALSVAASGLQLDHFINEDKSDSDVDKTGSAIGGLQALNGFIYLIDSIVVLRTRA